MPGGDLVQAFCRIISLLPPVKNFDESPEEKTLIACTYCVNSGIVLETLPTSHLLLFQPHMQAVFHLSLLSSSVACNCWDRQTPRRHLSEEAMLSANVLLIVLSTHSHWHTRDGRWWVLCLYSIFCNMHADTLSGNYARLQRGASKSWSLKWMRWMRKLHLLVALQERSGNHQSNMDLFSGYHGYLHQVS